MPLFPVASFVPGSACPHHGPIREGSVLCCMVCHQSGLDAHPSLAGAKPLPLDCVACGGSGEAEDGEACRSCRGTGLDDRRRPPQSQEPAPTPAVSPALTRKERRRLEREARARLPTIQEAIDS